MRGPGRGARGCPRSDQRSVDVDLKPHLSRYWLNAKAKETDPEGFARDVRAVCETYAGAPMAHMRGHHVMSADEKTGILNDVLAKPYRWTYRGRVLSAGAA